MLKVEILIVIASKNCCNKIWEKNGAVCDSYLQYHWL